MKWIPLRGFKRHHDVPDRIEPVEKSNHKEYLDEQYTRHPQGRRGLGKERDSGICG